MLDKTILVTGFGPFGVHNINASWAAVQLLDDLHFDGYKLIKHEIPVTYEYIDGNIARLWEEYNPTFVLHVGVSAEASAITLESLARRKFYCKSDANGVFHPTREVCAKDEGPVVHFPQINVEDIVAELDTDTLRFVESTNAGLYLCEYLFYTSLNVDNTRILFTHVPPLNQPYSAEKLAEALTKIIHSALKQLPLDEY
ncbi:pyroglutamyl-peptidase 1-like [Atheta coriaria]|uniref:pyroglutamyl-peptidase 1-like n=1 Tax=Dalotia coriaria TaxID=877792 RepID=UPI0031F458E2